MRKILNLSLSMLLVFSLAALVAPPALANQASIEAEYSKVASDIPPGPYDEAYVSYTGDDTTGTGTSGNPWRTVTKAVNMLPYDGGAGDPPGSTAAVFDRINVEPGWYGGTGPDDGIVDGNEEYIFVDNPVIIKSTDGPGTVGDPLTWISIPEDQLPKPDQVIEIESSDVRIDGLFLTMANNPIATGVFAHSPYIENVQILNCIIKVDQCDSGVGIDMYEVKYPVIDNNEIYVGTEGGSLLQSVSDAIGISMYDCPSAQITNNLLNVHGYGMAIGIEMDMCEKSWVGVLADGTPAPNTVNVLGGVDVLGIGIKAKDSPLIDINCNTVNVETRGDDWSMAFGIKVKKSRRADIIANIVTVDAELRSEDGGGFLMAMGIRLKKSHESKIMDNEVRVNGLGNVTETDSSAVSLSEEDEEDLADIEQVITELFGAQQFNIAKGYGVVIGIKVSRSWDVTVSGNNPVNVKLGLDIIAGDVGFAAGGGTGMAVGIKAVASPGIAVIGNTVLVEKLLHDWRGDKDTMVWTQVHAVEHLTLEHAGGGGKAIALGIALIMSPGLVSGNDVTADGDLTIEVKAVPTPGDLETSSALAIINTEMLGAIYQAITETVESESIDMQLTGDLPSIESFGHGGGLAVGIGILVLFSDGTVVTQNNPVQGIGDVIVDVWSQEETGPVAGAAGGGVGLGAGIAVIFSRSVEVTNNTDVSGTGTADVEVGAEHSLIQCAFAGGGGAGIGIGILLVGCPLFHEEAEGLTEGECWWDRPEVIGNTVTAYGAADDVVVKAVDLNPSHESMAIGGGLGLALGIAGVFYPSILIEANTVTADGYAKVDIYAEAVHEYDPLSMGGAAGIGIAISTVACWSANIIDNIDPTGTGEAYSEVGALEKLALGSVGFGGSLGLGEGILVCFSHFAKITGNAKTVGLGDAETDVIATSELPLGFAFSFSLASGIGKGIGVFFSDFAKVVECNIAAGEGSVRVYSTANADFDYAIASGMYADLDIVILCTHGVVEYNSMVDDTKLGTIAGPVLYIDAGLLNLGPLWSAKFNWWNDMTGPSGMGPGNGEPLVGFWVKFEPWLYVEHGEVLDDQIGKFGFSIHMCKGLNTLSTPIALNMDLSRDWERIVALSGLSGEVLFVDGWDPVTQTWYSVLDPAYDSNLDPLEAWYIYMFEECHSVILLVNPTRGHPYAMPTRELSARWDLIGPNPIFPEDGMKVGVALSSIEQTSAGLPGYTQCISPVVRCQDSWFYVPGMTKSKWMESGRGYWVWMENDDTLVGFGFTPLPDKL